MVLSVKWEVEKGWRLVNWGESGLAPAGPELLERAPCRLCFAGNIPSPKLGLGIMHQLLQLACGLGLTNALGKEQR